MTLTTLLGGTIGTAAELGPDSLSPLVAGAWRTMMEATGLIAISAIRGQAPWQYWLRTRWLALGGMSMAVTQLTFLEGVARAGVAVGTLVTIGVGPLVAGLIDWLAHRHRPTPHWLVGVGIGLTGIALLSNATADVVWSGMAFAVIAGVGIPCHAFSIQQVVKDRPLTTAVASIVGTGALMLLPAALNSLDTVVESAAAASTAAYLGLVTMTLAVVLWGIGLKHTRLSDAVVVGLLEPATATVLAALVLHEPFTATQATGICMVIIGAAVASLNPAARNTG